MDAVAPYTAGLHPKLALKWGLEALPRINQLRFAAAQKAATSPDCDRVTTAELFDLRSESADHWTIAVECVNGREFFYRQSDLKRRWRHLTEGRSSQSPFDLKTRVSKGLAALWRVFRAEP